MNISKYILIAILPLASMNQVYANTDNDINRKTYTSKNFVAKPCSDHSNHSNHSNDSSTSNNNLANQKEPLVQESSPLKLSKSQKSQKSQKIIQSRRFNHNPKNITINYGKQTIIKISANNINRISFAPSRIKNIIGDTSEFTALLSDNHSDMFITSKKSSGESIDISVIHTSGDIIDLRLDVTDIHKPVIANMHMPRTESDDGELLKKANSMLSNMRMGIKGGNYVQTVDQKLDLKLIPNIQCIHKKLYKYGKLHGSILELKNKTRSDVQLDEALLRSNFKNVIKFSGVKDVLPKRSTIMVYVIYEKQVD